jgi:succinyl-CoA synthetase beta subunit
LTEEESLPILAGLGLPVVPFRRADTPEEAVAVARSLSYPVVVKTAMPGVLHKSDLGGVLLNIESDAAVATAYADLSSRFGEQVLVQRQVDLASGVELILGMTVDPQFGPLVTVGLGGIWVELIEDALVFLAPCAADEVVARLPDLRGYKLLTGKRGKAAVDLAALGRLVERFSAVAAALAPQVAALDINPIVARGAEFLMVDALIVPANAMSRRATAE